MNLSKAKSLILLHFIVFIWGFTGVLGKLINMSSEHIVWNRMSIAFLSLFIINKFITYAFFTNGNPVLALSTTFLPAGKSHALDL